MKSICRKIRVGDDLPASGHFGRATAGNDLATLRQAGEQLEGQVKSLQELVPDQAAVMSHLAYHFTNLWFAASEENWPLADFYLSETRSNLKWAVRVKPKRKDPEGKETVDVKGIAESVDNGPLTKLKKTIVDKDKKAFIETYNDTLSACYACHKSSFKPYLRPQVPKAPEVRVIVTLRGEKKTDVHLFIYDADKKVVAKDDSPGPDCDAEFTPKESGKFTVVIRNLGPGDNRVPLKVVVAK